MTNYQPLKNVKKNAIFFKLFWYKVFVLRGLQLLNFLVDSVLISTNFLTWDTTFYQSTDQKNGREFFLLHAQLEIYKTGKLRPSQGLRFSFHLKEINASHIYANKMLISKHLILVNQPSFTSDVAPVSWLVSIGSSTFASSSLFSDSLSSDGVGSGAWTVS